MNEIQRYLRDQQHRYDSVTQAAASLERLSGCQSLARASARALGDLTDLTDAAAAARRCGFSNYAAESLDELQRLADFALDQDALTKYADVPGSHAQLGAQLARSAIAGVPSCDLFPAGAAQLAAEMTISPHLEKFRLGEAELATRMMGMSSAVEWHAQELQAFAEVSAYARLLTEAPIVNGANLAALDALAGVSLSSIETLAGCHAFLDAAGLAFTRMPRLRKRTDAELRRRFQDRVRSVREPKHYKRAKTLIHEREQVLREIIDEQMTEVYGEDWPDERLALCGCADLLKRWKAEGGFVLHHACYRHYRKIMTHVEHFETAFSGGFADSKVLASLLEKVGDLRAASHHAKPFTPDDLLQLRAVWRTIESGLIRLDDGLCFE